MPYAAVTLAQLRTSIALRWENTPFWTNANIDDGINEALRCWNALTGYWKTSINITTVANQSWYNLSNSLTYATVFTYNNTPIAQTFIKDIDNGRPNWEAETTNTAGLPTVPKLWLASGLRLVAFWPAVHLTNETIVAQGVAKTPILVNAGDFIDIGQEEQSALEGYALHAASFKVGGDIWKSTFHYYKEFIQAAATRNELLKASSFYRRTMGLNQNLQANPAKFPSNLAEIISSAASATGAS